MTAPCSCKNCQSLCRHNPGVFSVEEAKAAIAAGFGPDRMMICHRTTSDGRSVLVMLPASRHSRKGVSNVFRVELYDMLMGLGLNQGGCRLLTEDGRCSIHDSGFKPIECRLSYSSDCERGRDDEVHEHYERERDAAFDAWAADDAQAMLLAWAKAHKISKRRITI